MARPAVAGLNHRLPHFQHLFSGSGYAAGYYVYLWAEVLDADAYDAFVEAGDPFDAEVAQRVRRWIYSSGNSIEPGAAYEAFRGRAASIEPMLQRARSHRRLDIGPTGRHRGAPQGASWGRPLSPLAEQRIERAEKIRKSSGLVQ